jgi:molybdate transport system regulatory protein
MLRQSHRLRVRNKVWLEAEGGFAVGDGGIELLRAVETSGSLRGAAAGVGWSYRHALRYLNNAERACGTELVARARGGHTRGGARLTPAGRDLLRRYARFRRRLDVALQRLYASAFVVGAPGAR